MMSYLLTTTLTSRTLAIMSRRSQSGQGSFLAGSQGLLTPVMYFNSGHTDKKAIAGDVQAQDKLRRGLVCVLSCLDPCWMYQIHRNRLTKKLEFRLSPGKCLCPYHYQIHPFFGFLQCPHSNLLPLLHTDLHERPGMACRGKCKPLVSTTAAGQLLSLDCELCQSAALDGASAQDQLAQAVQRHRSTTEPKNRDRLIEADVAREFLAKAGAQNLISDEQIRLDGPC